MSAIPAHDQLGSPIFLPSLLPRHEINGLRTYASDPVIDMLETGGDISGTRIEKVTLIAEGGGSGMAPAVELAWFDLDTQTVQTARLDAFPLSVDGPAATSADPSLDGLDMRRPAFLGGMLMVALAIVLLNISCGFLPARSLLSDIRNRWQLSEFHAWRALRRVVRQRDYAGLRPAIDRWTRRLGTAGIARDQTLQSLLIGLGEARYSTRNCQEQQDWRSIERRLIQLRRAARASLREGNLPPLNRAS